VYYYKKKKTLLCFLKEPFATIPSSIMVIALVICTFWSFAVFDLELINQEEA